MRIANSNKTFRQLKRFTQA